MGCRCARTREQLNVALWAYVIMPEHVHVLLHPRGPHYEMRRILPLLLLVGAKIYFNCRAAAQA